MMNSSAMITNCFLDTGAFWGGVSCTIIIIMAYFCIKETSRAIAIQYLRWLDQRPAARQQEEASSDDDYVSAV